MMRWMIVIFFLMGSFWYPTKVAFASSKECDPKDSKSCVAILAQGEVAPFTGQLLTLRRAAKLGAKAGMCNERIKQAVEEAEEMSGIDLQLQKHLRASDAEFWKIEKGLLLRTIDDVEKAGARDWTEHPTLWVAVGAAVTTAIFYAAVKTVNHAAK